MSGYAGSGPREILPGLTHWSVGWQRYSLESYAIEQPDGCVLIDPSDYPPHAIGAIERNGVSDILITNHYHERAAAMLRGRFGAKVWAPEGDIGELESVAPDHVFNAETELPAGLRGNRARHDHRWRARAAVARESRRALRGRRAGDHELLDAQRRPGRRPSASATATRAPGPAGAAVYLAGRGPRRADSRRCQGGPAPLPD